MELVSFADFASIKGRSKPAITYAAKDRIKDAIVERDGRKWLDRDLALELWEKNTTRNHTNDTALGRKEPNPQPQVKKGKPRRARRTSKPEPPPPAAETSRPRQPTTRQRLKAEVDRLPDDAIPDFNQSRARKEHYQAELSKLQVTQQRGELVPADQVKKDAFNVGRAVREALSNLADRLSHQLAGETDPVVIHKLLSDEHRSALLELAGGEK